LTTSNVIRDFSQGGSLVCCLPLYFFLPCIQRLSVCAVRDCGVVSCPPTLKFERATTLEYPLKPLWHIHFVSVSLFIFLVIFLSFLLHPFCLPCGWTDTLFAKLGLEGRLERFGNVCGCKRWLVLSFQINSSYCQNVVCLCLE